MYTMEHHKMYTKLVMEFHRVLSQSYCLSFLSHHSVSVSLFVSLFPTRQDGWPTTWTQALLQGFLRVRILFLVIVQVSKNEILATEYDKTTSTKKKKAGAVCFKLFGSFKLLTCGRSSCIFQHHLQWCESSFKFWCGCVEINCLA